MITRRTVALVLLLVAAGWLALRGLPRWFEPAPQPPAPRTAAPVEGQGPKIKARLFYVADDGQHLIGVERDVPYSNQTAEQARAILQAQLAAVSAPLVSPIPSGTQLRAVYITPEGEAYVDLSRDVATAHPGGLVNEMLTIYAIVHAITVNLPAVTAVQMLVDGKEVDTLAGHIDLRRPLPKHLQLVLGP